MITVLAWDALDRADPKRFEEEDGDAYDAYWDGEEETGTKKTRVGMRTATSRVADPWLEAGDSPWMKRTAADPERLHPFHRAQPPVGRNDPCPCGSAKIQEVLPEQAKASARFPIGTIALYGPDDKRTTKIVAGVIKEEGAEAIIERYVGTTVMDDPQVQEKIKDFFLQHGVASVVATERNMGCPHEEGKDFPVGGDCPFCPYWKGKQGSGTWR